MKLSVGDQLEIAIDVLVANGAYPEYAERIKEAEEKGNSMRPLTRMTLADHAERERSGNE